MVHLSALPSELLVKILELATDNPVRDIESLVAWTPFESSCSTDVSKQCKDALRTKYALSLVCSSFRRLSLELSLELLYEDIWIRHGSDGLREALEPAVEKRQPGLGSYVKRVSISFAGDRESRQSQRSIYENTRRILLCCPNIRSVSHPQEVVAGLPIDDLDFPFLHRVDWQNTHYDVPLTSVPPPHFIWHSLFLRVLMVGAVNLHGEHIAGIVVSLPHVETLGIRTQTIFGNERNHSSVSLPALRSLVIGHPDAIYNFALGYLAPFSSQITTLEIGADIDFLRRDFVTPLLSHCPNATELYIPITTTRSISRNEMPRVVLEFAVRRVHLHTGTLVKYNHKESPWWTLLQEHFEGLCGTGSRLSKLESLILHGSYWKDTVEDARFATLLRLTRDKGVTIESEEAELQHALSRWAEASAVRVLDC